MEIRQRWSQALILSTIQSDALMSFHLVSADRYVVHVRALHGKYTIAMIKEEDGEKETK